MYINKSHKQISSSFYSGSEGKENNPPPCEDFHDSPLKSDSKTADATAKSAELPLAKRRKLKTEERWFSLFPDSPAQKIDNDIEQESYFKINSNYHKQKSNLQSKAEARFVYFDDSSDEETAKLESKTYNLILEFERFKNNSLPKLIDKLSSSNLEPTILDSFMLHSIGERLIYSPEVNSVYYNYLKRTILGLSDSQSVELITHINKVLSCFLDRQVFLAINATVVSVKDSLNWSFKKVVDDNLRPLLDKIIETIIESDYLFKVNGLPNISKQLYLKLIEDLILTLSIRLANLISKLKLEQRVELIYDSGGVILSQKIKNIILNKFFTELDDELRLKVFSFVRKTLPSNFQFERITGIKELLASFRIIQRSFIRHKRNLWFNHDLRSFQEDKQASVVVWPLGNIQIIDNITIYNPNFSRTDHIANLGTYEKVKESFIAKKKLCLERDKALQANYDSKVATWIRDLLNGRLLIDGLDNNPNFSDQFKSSYKSYLYNFGFLLLGGEVMRNPGTLPITQMVIDLVIAGHLSWLDALEKLPMACSDAVAVSRKLQQAYHGHLFYRKQDYYPGLSRASRAKVITMLTKESEILQMWLCNIANRSTLAPDDTLKLIEKYTLNWFEQKLSLLNEISPKVKI